MYIYTFGNNYLAMTDFNNYVHCGEVLKSTILSSKTPYVFKCVQCQGAFQLNTFMAHFEQNLCDIPEMSIKKEVTDCSKMESIGINKIEENQSHCLNKNLLVKEDASDAEQNDHDIFQCNTFIPHFEQNLCEMRELSIKKKVTECSEVFGGTRAGWGSYNTSKTMDTQLIDSFQGEFTEHNNNNCQNEILNTLARIDCKLNKMDERQIGLDDKLMQIQSTMNQILRKNVSTSTEKLFPISSLEGLCNAENAVAFDIEKYGQLIKLIISPDGLFKNFNRILTNNVIMAINYDGVNNKKSFKDYKSLNQALFYATNIEGSTNEDFVKELRKCFRTYKSRAFKRNYDQRKKIIEPSKQ